MRAYDQESDPIMRSRDGSRLVPATLSLCLDPLEPEYRGDVQRCHFPGSSGEHEQHEWWSSPERIVHICPGLRIDKHDGWHRIEIVPRVRRPFDHEADLNYPGDGLLRPRYHTVMR